MSIRITHRYVDGSGNLVITGTSAVYIGDKNTNGSWRIVRNGNDFEFQRREGGTWVEKGAMQP